MDLTLYFTSFGALAGLVIIITEFLKNLLKANTTWSQVISWGVSMLLVFIGNIFSLGAFVGLTPLWIAIYGIATGLVANGLFDINIIQAILEFIKLRKPATPVSK